MLNLTHLWFLNTCCLWKQLFTVRPPHATATYKRRKFWARETFQYLFGSREGRGGWGGSACHRRATSCTGPHRLSIWTWLESENAERCVEPTGPGVSEWVSKWAVRGVLRATPHITGHFADEPLHAQISSDNLSSQPPENRPNHCWDAVCWRWGRPVTRKWRVSTILVCFIN